MLCVLSSLRNNLSHGSVVLDNDHTDSDDSDDSEAGTCCNGRNDGNGRNDRNFPDGRNVPKPLGQLLV